MSVSSGRDCIGAILQMNDNSYIWYSVYSIALHNIVYYIHTLLVYILNHIHLSLDHYPVVIAFHDTSKLMLCFSRQAIVGVLKSQQYYGCF